MQYDGRMLKPPLLALLLLLAACDPTIIVGHALETGFILTQPGYDQANRRPAPGVVTKPEAR